MSHPFAMILGIVNNLEEFEDITTLEPTNEDATVTTEAPGFDNIENDINDDVVVFNDVSEERKTEDLVLESLPILSKLKGTDLRFVLYPNIKTVLSVHI